MFVFVHGRCSFLLFCLCSLCRISFVSSGAAEVQREWRRFLPFCLVLFLLYPSPVSGGGISPGAPVPYIPQCCLKELTRMDGLTVRESSLIFAIRYHGIAGGTASLLC